MVLDVLAASFVGLPFVVTVGEGMSVLGVARGVTDATLLPLAPEEAAVRPV